MQDLQPMEVVQSAMVVVEDAPPVEIESTEPSPQIEDTSAGMSEIVVDDTSPDPVDTESE